MTKKNAIITLILLFPLMLFAGAYSAGDNNCGQDNDSYLIVAAPVCVFLFLGSILKRPSSRIQARIFTDSIDHPPQ